MNAQIIAIANQKGGVGKTTTCENLGIGLALGGKKVLLVDGDPQGSLTISLGHPQPDQLPVTLSDMMGKILTDQPIAPGEGILHHAEGVDLMPADIQLSGMEVSLVNAMSRETILRQYLDTVKRDYTHILIDCQPSLGMLTVNALAAANRVLIPVQAEYLPAKGLEQLLQTISKVRRQINPKLQIDGILLTMVDSHTNFAKEISTLLRVRSCDDVDETALSFAEIKALCAGDPRIKERMDLDVEVSRLKLMKADHQSKQFRLEDNLLKYFPEQIEKNKGFIAALEKDMETLTANPHPEDGFAGMEIRGDLLTDKENAGAALLDACKEVKGSDPVQIGSYRGFAMSVSFSAIEKKYELSLRGEMTQRAELGTDARGNLIRIDNALAQMSQRLESVKTQLENLYQQQAAAKAEVGKPFPAEAELKEKNARLLELDMLLNMDGKGGGRQEAVVAKSERPSVLEGLKRPLPPRTSEPKIKKHEEVR